MPCRVLFFFIFWSLFYITKLINFYCICINIENIFRKNFKLKINDAGWSFIWDDLMDNCVILKVRIIFLMKHFLYFYDYFYRLSILNHPLPQLVIRSKRQSRPVRQSSGRRIALGCPLPTRSVVRKHPGVVPVEMWYRRRSEQHDTNVGPYMINKTVNWNSTNIGYNTIKGTVLATEKNRICNG